VNAYVWRWPAHSRGKYGLSQGLLHVGISKVGMSDHTSRAHTETWYAGFPDLEFWATFTRHLPKWVYVYLAPQHWSHDVDGYALPRYPVMINQGRVSTSSNRRRPRSQGD
jgi:hypothetical protein